MGRLNPNAASLAAIALIGGVAACALLTPALMPAALGLLLALLLLAVAYAAPVAATFLWLLIVETTPEMWLSDLVGGHELVIAVLKIVGLVLVAVTALRYGPRLDRFNPGFAFVAMFVGGFVHGLWPGLGMVASARSLIGSAAPFASGFAHVPDRWRRAVVRAVIIGPGVTVLFGLVLAGLGIRALYYTQLGAVRLSASSNPAFLAGFALTGIYAGVVEFLRAGRGREFGWIGLNLVILMATGARAPLFFAVMILVAVVGFIPSPHLPAQRRAMLMAVGGAGFALVLIASSALHFIRVIDLLHLGDAGDLSNRNLVWPVFEAAVASSPWMGWGVGAGKVIVPLHSALGIFLGTNAAHEEYLRIAAEGGGLGLVLLLLLIGLWVVRGSAALPVAQRRAVRLVFIAFALHSATDNTLIATTSLAFFTWARAVLVFGETSVVNGRRAIRDG